MTLSTRPFGFDKEEVRICIENLTRDYEDARREIDRLTAELQVAATKSRQPLQETVGVQVERVLAGAYRIAEEVKSEAESTAKQLLREAQEEAAQLRTQAAADAAALTRTAATRVAELESEIQEMTDRRQVVQAMLDRAADRLNQIAQDMRQGVIPPASPVQGHPQAPRAQEAAIL
jgi:hypothetical protein